MKQHGNKKDYIRFFTESSSFKELLGDYTLSDKEKKELTEFFSVYTDRDGTWRKNICIWIQNNLSDWVNRRKLLSQCKSNSYEWHKLMYGDNAPQKFEEQTRRLKKSLPSMIEYWTGKGFDVESSIQKIKESQKKAVSNRVFERNTSIRCQEYWIDKGYDIEEAKKMISSLQKRDLDFFILKYGEEEGKKKFEKIKKSKKSTWEGKDKVEHGRKTAQKVFNPNGQEMKSIMGFIQSNKIPIQNCKYGSPKNQFWQYIPEIGYRRYDLAVFSDESHTKLVCIMEFHGPGHVNFSDYRPELENEVITISGKILPHLGTYGMAYKNDLKKKEHILKNFNDVQYVVMWVDDLINKRFKIDELLQKRN